MLISSSLFILLLPLTWSKLISYSELLNSKVCSCRPVFENCSPPEEGITDIKCSYPTKPCCSHKHMNDALSQVLKTLDKNYSRLNKRDASQTLVGPSLGKPSRSSTPNQKTCSCVSSNQCEDGNLDFTFGESCGFGMVRCCIASRGVNLPYNLVHQESYVNSTTTTKRATSPSPVYIQSTTEPELNKFNPQINSEFLVNNDPLHHPEQPTAPSREPNPIFQHSGEQKRTPAPLKPGDVISIPNEPRPNEQLRPGQVTSLSRYPNAPLHPGQQASLSRNPPPRPGQHTTLLRFPNAPLRPGQHTSLPRHPNPSFQQPLRPPPFRQQPSPLLKKTQYSPQIRPGRPTPLSQRRQPPQHLHRQDPRLHQRPLTPQEIEEMKKKEAAKRAFYENQRRAQEQQLQKRRLERLKKKRPSTKEYSTFENLSTIFQRFFG